MNTAQSLEVGTAKLLAALSAAESILAALVAHEDVEMCAIAEALQGTQDAIAGVGPFTARLSNEPDYDRE
jgi:hypothetical protein